MENAVYVKTYSSPPIDVKEIMRYAKIGVATPDMDALILECLSELENKLSYKVCFKKVPVSVTETGVDFGCAFAQSEDLARNLCGAKYAILFVATIGIEIDRLIRKYSVLSPAKGVIFQAIGAERCESLCDVFSKEITESMGFLRPRFSPGYGDFLLEFQREIFKMLEPAGKIGVTLGENLLMSPSKSVTAILGVK